ncbi:hypothetical protein FOL47_005620 [Perkinsus chesapeaki]|uniref:Uncharacterized protein n=1 Tax=Perkinsus chesapeaki TaxID=330153 RepID=A0A7J6MYG0_PERCH|nr:hypothetical protein FOL47_005620 [Perkinsus chesapeaki]
MSAAAPLSAVRRGAGLLPVHRVSSLSQLEKALKVDGGLWPTIAIRSDSMIDRSLYDGDDIIVSSRGGVALVNDLNLLRPILWESAILKVMHDCRGLCSRLLDNSGGGGVDDDDIEIHNVYDTLVGHWAIEEMSGETGDFGVHEESLSRLCRQFGIPQTSACGGLLPLRKKQHKRLLVGNSEMADGYVVDRSKLFTSVYPKLNKEFTSSVPPRKLPAGTRLSGMVSKIAYYDSSVLGGSSNLPYEETADPKKDGMLVLYWKLNIWPGVLGVTPPSEANEKISRGLRVGHVVDDLFTVSYNEGGICFDEDSSLLFVAPKGRDAWLAEDAELLGEATRVGHTSMRHLPQDFASMGPEFALPPKKSDGPSNYDVVYKKGKRGATKVRRVDREKQRQKRFDED